MMVIRKEELTLYSLSLLEADDRSNAKFSKENLSYALDISLTTLDLYFTKLKNASYVIRYKKKYFEDLRQTVEISEDGKKAVIEIKKKIEEEILTPERHNIPSTVKVQTILNRIEDTLERIFFLSLFTRLKRFDLPFYLETIRTAKHDSNIVNVLSDIEGDDVMGEEVPIVEMFYKTCYYGDMDMEALEKGSSCGSDVNTFLIVAEASVKQGRYEEARSIYEYILSPKVNINQNQWFMARAGLALLINKAGDMKSSLKQLDDLINKVDNKIQRAFCKQLMARIISTTDDHEKALQLFHSVIRSLTASGIPLLLSITYNNLGVLYFRMNDLDNAEDVWKKARRYAKESHSHYMEGPILGNLADIEIHKGNLEKSKQLLDHAWQVHEEMADYEGRAYIDFNYALHFLERKEIDNAVKHFKRAMEIAYPSPSPRERKEMKDVFLERAYKNGFNEDVLQADDYLKGIL